MAQYQVLILPLLALVLVILFPVFDKNLSRSRSWRSRRRRRVICGRVTVVALLLAPLITNIWPAEQLNVLLHSVFVAAVLGSPFYIVSWILSLRYSGNDSSETSGSSIVDSRAAVDSGTDSTDLTTTASKKLAVSITADQMREVRQRGDGNPAALAGTATFYDVNSASESTVQTANTASTQDPENVQGVSEKTGGPLAGLVPFYNLDDWPFKSWQGQEYLKNLPGNAKFYCPGDLASVYLQVQTSLDNARRHFVRAEDVKTWKIEQQYQKLAQALQDTREIINRSKIEHKMDELV